MDVMRIVIAASMVVVGLTTVGYAGIAGSWVNTDLFTVPVLNLSITPLALMGLVPLSLGAGMLLSGADLLRVRDDVYGPALV
jgi:hypothetical protein